MESLLQDPDNMELEQVYNNYGVQAVQVSIYYFCVFFYESIFLDDVH